MTRYPLQTLAATTVAVLLLGACGDSTAPNPGTLEDSTSTDSMPTRSDPALTDADLRALAQLDASWTWWEHTDSLLARAGSSPHGDRIRVRYNAVAATQLDSLGRLVATPEFPDSSAVVKEVWADGARRGILVMHKAVDDPNAGHGSWLWFEYADGAVAHSVTADDGVCHNCHVTGVDHMRMGSP